jgi:hypothetical protein
MQQGNNPFGGMSDGLKKLVDRLATALLAEGKCPTPCDVICATIAALNFKMDGLQATIEVFEEMIAEGKITKILLRALQQAEQEIQPLKDAMQEAKDFANALGCKC